MFDLDPNAPPPPPELRADVEKAFDQARNPVAPGPAANVDGLADAYLGLLKLALCDLVAPRTMSVRRTDQGVASQELRDAWLKLRSLGMDWPRYGLSMVGLSRLDDLQECVRSVVADGVAGDLIETGTWRGGASMLMRATLDTLGDDRTVWVADSFTGFREDLQSEDLAEVDFLAVSLEEVTDNFARLGLTEGVEFLPGYFEDTLHKVANRRWAICRLDGDSYGATQTCLETLYPNLSAGGYLIVDDYYVLEECRAAVDEFRAQHGIDDPIEQVDWTGARWRRRSDQPVVPARSRDTPVEAPHDVPPAVERPPYTPVPSVEELHWRREAEVLRARVAELEAAAGRSGDGAVARVVRRLRSARR